MPRIARLPSLSLALGVLLVFAACAQAGPAQLRPLGSLTSVASLPAPDSSTSLLAHRYALSLLGAVRARIGEDYPPVASRAGGVAFDLPVSSWPAALGWFPVLGVHDENHGDRSQRERSQLPRRRGGFGAPTAAVPVERGDWSLWSRVDSARTGGHDEALQLPATAQTVHLGIETRIDAPSGLPAALSSALSSGTWLAGVGVGLSAGSVERSSPGAAWLDQSVPFLYPYLGYRDDRMRFHALVAVGAGESEMSLDGVVFGPVQETQALVAGAGGAFVLGGRPDSLQLSLRGSASAVGVSVDGVGTLSSVNIVSSTAQVHLDLRHSRELAGGRLRPFAGLGALAHGGSSLSGKAYELHAGVRFDWRRLSASADVSQTFGDGEVLDPATVISGALRYSPAPGALGLFLSVAPLSAADFRVDGAVSPKGVLRPAPLPVVQAGYGFRAPALAAPVHVVVDWTPSGQAQSLGVRLRLDF